MERPCGLLLLDKPTGPTSHDVVAVVRRACGERRAGHAGTLDPLASGLLLVCLGAATRICEYLVGHDKRYDVEARLGAETDSHDAQGEFTMRHEGPLPDDDAIARAVEAFHGEVVQVPPAYSAVKVGGEPLYRRARRGEAVVAKPRRVSVYSFAWDRPNLSLLRLHVHCSAGTYVRSLVHDLGHALGCGAYVESLRRTAVGRFAVDEALSLDEARARLARGDLSALLPIRDALSDMPVVVFDEQASSRLRMGQAVPGGTAAGSQPHLALAEDGQALGIVCAVGETWRARKVFAYGGTA